MTKDEEIAKLKEDVIHLLRMREMATNTRDNLIKRIHYLEARLADMRYIIDRYENRLTRDGDVGEPWEAR